MARNKKIDGFSFEDIVNTNINNNIDIDTKDNNNVDEDNSNFLENLKPEKEKKVKTLLYIDSDIANHLDYYGEKLGKKNGGKSKFSNELFKKFLEDNGLWSEKIASKKRK